MDWLFYDGRLWGAKTLHNVTQKRYDQSLVCQEKTSLFDIRYDIIEGGFSNIWTVELTIYRWGLMKNINQVESDEKRHAVCHANNHSEINKRTCFPALSVNIAGSLLWSDNNGE